MNGAVKFSVWDGGVFFFFFLSVHGEPGSGEDTRPADTFPPFEVLNVSVGRLRPDLLEPCQPCAKLDVYETCGIRIRSPGYENVRN